MMKRLTPVRLLRNEFSTAVEEAEQRGASNEELTQLLGRARAKKGMFEGDLEQGELEVGQLSAYVRRIQPAAEIVREVVGEFDAALAQLCALSSR